MRKYMKLGRRYFIINTDEPYAEKIFKILKKGQLKKGEWPEGKKITFEQWKKITFPIEIGIKNRGESVADICDEMADKIGIYGCGKEDHSECDANKCRVLFVSELEYKIYEAKS